MRNSSCVSATATPRLRAVALDINESGPPMNEATRIAILASVLYFTSNVEGRSGSYADQIARHMPAGPPSVAVAGLHGPHPAPGPPSVAVAGLHGPHPAPRGGPTTLAAAYLPPGVRRDDPRTWQRDRYGLPYPPPAGAIEAPVAVAGLHGPHPAPGPPGVAGLPPPEVHRPEKEARVTRHLPADAPATKHETIEPPTSRREVHNKHQQLARLRGQTYRQPGAPVAPNARVQAAAIRLSGGPSSPDAVGAHFSDGSAEASAPGRGRASRSALMPNRRVPGSPPPPRPRVMPIVHLPAAVRSSVNKSSAAGAAAPRRARPPPSP